jgi:putative ABC transport system permease protein
LLAGTVAATAASIIAGVITVQIFNLPWHFETSLLLYGIFGGTLLALVTGLWATRRVTEAPPNETLRTL